MADRAKLPYIDLTNFKGLYTKSSPDVVTAEQLRIAENCDFFETYGALSKTKGNARILNSCYSESGSTKPISWIEFYKASDLDGRILRHTLVAAGTTLGRVESDGTITNLKSNRTNGLFHTSATLDRFMFITNQNPDLVGEGDDLVKYDGAVVSNWGIVAPGSTETVIDTFDSASTWPGTPGDITVVDDVTTTWDGDSISISKSSNSSARFSVEKAITPFYPIQDERDSSRSVANRVNFFTFIPRGQLTADCIQSGTFDQAEALKVWVSPDSSTVDDNHWRFYFSIGELVEGWNRLNLNFAGAPQNPSGQFYPETDRIKRIKFDFLVDDETTIRSNIKLDRLQLLDQGTPIANGSGTGTLSGVYQYKVTYVSKYGHESNAGPSSVGATISSNSQIDLTNIPVSSDPQVIARQIYRTVANGSIFLFLDRINDNTKTTYTDRTPDGSLGTSTPPQAGDFSDDNSPPPQAGIVKRWKDTLFMAGDPQNPTILYFSDAGEPESFPLINTFELDEKITAMYETYSTLIIETETGKWQVLGDNPDFSVDKIVDNMGCVGRRAAGETRLIGYAMDRDGLRLFDGNNPLKISEPIRDKYDTEIDRTNIELAHTVHSKSRNSITQFNPDNTIPVPNYTSAFNFIYSIDDPNQGYWTTLEIPSDINIIDATEIEDANGDFKVYGSSSDGMVYELFKTGALNWTDAAGNTTAIKTKFRTPYLRLGELGKETEGVSGRVRPKFVELRLRNNTAITWNVTIESADGSAQEVARDSQSIDFTFGTNNSLIRRPLKINFAAGEYVRFTVETNEKDTFAEVVGLRVYFHVLPFEGEKTTVANV